MIIRYAAACLRTHQQDMAYRFYITDALYSISNTMAHCYGGSHLQKRYHEILHPCAQDGRSGEEVAIEVIRSIGLEFTQDESV